MNLHTQSIVWMALALAVLSLHLILSYLVWRHVRWPGLLLELASLTLVTSFLWLGLIFVIAIRTGFSSHPFTWPEHDALMNVIGLFGLPTLLADLLGILGVGNSFLSVAVSLYVAILLLGLLPVFLVRPWRKGVHV